MWGGAAELSQGSKYIKTFILAAVNHKHNVPATRIIPTIQGPEPNNYTYLKLQATPAYKPKMGMSTLSAHVSLFTDSRTQVDAETAAAAAATIALVQAPALVVA